jgi:hypothetical protein
MTARALRTLLEGLIDYAGLFPPAALSMDEAVRNYARYRQGPYAWALGRFVVPQDRVGEVPGEFPVSVLWSDPSSTAGFQPAPSEGRQDAGGTPLEVKASTSEDVDRIAATAAGRTVYVEVTDLALLDAIAKHGLRAKIRAGGVTADAFPAPEAIAHFIRACRDAGLSFKATAGLHHPVRCVKPLTYAADAPRGTMHGFVNVFLAAAKPERAEDILGEEDPRAFVFSDRGVTWRGEPIDISGVRRFATSFGSCSFEEPIADLKELGWLQ